MIYLSNHLKLECPCNSLPTLEPYTRVSTLVSVSEMGIPSFPLKTEGDRAVIPCLTIVFQCLPFCWIPLTWSGHLRVDMVGWFVHILSLSTFEGICHRRLMRSTQVIYVSWTILNADINTQSHRKLD